MTVKNEIFNSKMKFLIRGVLFPGDGIGKNWNKDKLKKYARHTAQKSYRLGHYFCANVIKIKKSKVFLKIVIDFLSFL